MELGRALLIVDFLTVGHVHKEVHDVAEEIQVDQFEGVWVCDLLQKHILRAHDHLSDLAVVVLGSDLHELGDRKFVLRT